MRKLKIGVVSCSQLSFPGDKHSAFQRNMEAMRKLADKWDFDLFVYGQDVIVADDARAAVTVLEDEKVDFVLVQTTSFSAGFLAPIFAKTRNARLGLWAIPEGARDGAVPFNSFCGINMYSAIIGHYLNQEKVPLKWFFGNADDPAFLERFRITVCALKAIQKMGQSSVALIGGIAPGFDDLYDDERNLIRLFDGLRINRLHEYDEIKKLAESMDPEQVRQRMAQEIAQSRGFTSPVAERMMEINARYSLAYEAFLQKFGYDAIAVSCWPKFQEDYLYSVCAVVGELNEKGVVTACEGDLTSAICMLLLKYIAEDETMLMDMSAFDQEDDSILETSLSTLMYYPICFHGCSIHRTDDLQRFINEMVDDGYALTTIKKQYHLVTAYLKFANTEGIIPCPIYNNVHLPTRQAVKKKRREVYGYSQSEQAALNHVLRRRLVRATQRRCL